MKPAARGKPYAARLCVAAHSRSWERRDGRKGQRVM